MPMLTAMVTPSPTYGLPHAAVSDSLLGVAGGLSRRAALTHPGSVAASAAAASVAGATKAISAMGRSTSFVWPGDVRIPTSLTAASALPTTPSVPSLPSSGDVANTFNNTEHAIDDAGRGVERTAEESVKEAEQSYEESDQVSREFNHEVRALEKAEHQAEEDLVKDEDAKANKASIYLDQLRCFPGESHIYVQGRGPAVPLRSLQRGDRVLCGGVSSSSTATPEASASDALCFAPFLGFLHADAEVRTRFLVLRLRGRERFRPLRLTSDHLVFVARRGEAGTFALPAGSLRSGDYVFAVSPLEGRLAPAEVLSVAPEDCDGAFAPLTEVGSIVVDGVLCSNYADVVGWGPGFHDLAHHALGLPRALGGPVGGPLSGLLCRALGLADKERAEKGFHPAAEVLLAVFNLLPLATWRRLVAVPRGCACSGPEQPTILAATPG